MSCIPHCHLAQTKSGTMGFTARLRSRRQILSYFDRDKSGWRRGINHATCTASRWGCAIDRRGSNPTGYGQWVDANLLGELPLVEPGVPELTHQLIDLGLVTTPATALDVMHPSLSPGSKQIGNHGVHRTLTCSRNH